MKELRIKEAYMNGIDSMEEYRDNKLLLQQERQNLNAKIAACHVSPALPENLGTYMKKRIQNVYDIISSNKFSDQEKNEALRSVVEKIIYNREKDTADIYYYYL